MAYIEREAAIKALMNDAPEQVGYSREDAADCIRYMDAADVAPVQHARWLCVDTDTEQFFLCNRCKKKEYWESDYCPNCGAKMDGKGVGQSLNRGGSYRGHLNGK